MDELLAQFLVEGPELVQQAGADLMALSRTPSAPGRLDSAFRAIHTLKGSVGLFDLEPMGTSLHAAEDLLDAVRAGRTPTSPEVLEMLLACVDQTDRWLSELESNGALSPDAARLAESLSGQLRAAVSEVELTAAPAPATKTGPADWAAALRARHPDLPPDLVAVRYTPDEGAYFQGDDPLAIVRAAPGTRAVEVALQAPPAADYDPYQCNLVLHLLTEATPEAITAAFRFVSDQIEIDRPEAADAVAEPAAPEPGFTTRTLRIDAARVDAIADLVDALVIAKNGLPDSGAVDRLDPAELRSRLAASRIQIDRLTAALHGGVMSLRLTPLAPVFGRLGRQVREIAATLGKPCQLLVTGETVEADKSIVDSLYEPLLHLVRNALDHGVEAAAGRRSSGKAATARLTLEARQAGDRLLITVSDDGAGIDPTAIRTKAVARGVVDAITADGLSDEALLDLVFAPGFSTADAVSDLSGRGVGMDAVRTSVAAVGGKVVLSSEVGAGTRVDLILPLTLSLSRIVVVETGGERFGIPLEAVRETLRLAGDSIVPVRHGRAFVLRDVILPLLDLAEILGMPDPATQHRESTVLVVVGPDGEAGLQVDAIHERLDVVLRPMTGLLAATRGFAGTTVLGDGAVLVILDVPELLA
jgi:two-component system, chemotaxis family, sensor kinase CheA